MKQKIFMLLALVCMTLTASAGDVPTYSLTKANGAEAHGTITFKVGENTVTSAEEGQTVTVVIAPAEGWAVNKPSGQWIAAIASAPHRVVVQGSNIDLLDDIEFTPVEGEENTWTFTMQRANAEIGATYKKLLTHTDITIEDIADLTYTGEELEPTVVVKDGTTTLVEGTDYTVTYSNNVNACEADAAENAPTVTITAVETSENYAGEASVTFTIKKAQPVVTFLGEEEYNELLKEPFESPVATIEPEGLPIVYSSSDEDVATVDPETGEVSFIGIGTVTITAAFEGNDNYEPAEDSYTINIEHRVFTIDFTKEPNKGSVTLSAKKAIEYDEITVSVLPDAGYVITEVTVVTDGGETVEYAESAGENEREVVYTFSMPYDNVTFNVKFENKNVEGREVKTGDGNTYVVTDPDAKTVIVEETDPNSNIIVIPATVYDAETGVEYTVTGVSNKAFKGRGDVTDVYVENTTDVVAIDSENFVTEMPNAKLHVYQTLLKDYADMMPELLDGHRLVTDIKVFEKLFTYSNSCPLLLPEGIQQYSAEVKGAKSLWGPAAAPAVVTVECTPIVDDVLPASTGVVMTAEPGEYELAATKNIAKGNYNGNQLKAIEKKTVISAYWGVYDMQKGVFVPVDPSFRIVDDCKAILKIEGDNLPDEIEVVLKEIPTGINAIDNGKLTMDNGYDLSGRKLSNGKLSNSQLPKGIYIVNGKKVVLK